MTNFEIRKDYSFMIDTQDESYQVDPRYDYVRVFPALAFGVINIMTENGINKLYTDEEQCRLVAAQGLPLVELDWIVESENEVMRQIQIQRMDDEWLL